GQWAFDVLAALDWLALQPGLDPKRFAVAGLGQAGVVALVAAGLLDDRVASAAALDAPATFVTETAYGKTTRMGVLAPGLLRVGDVPQLAALVAPRKLVISGGATPTGGHLREKALR